MPSDGSNSLFFAAWRLGVRFSVASLRGRAFSLRG